MGNDVAIKVTNLSKVYKLYNNPRDRFKEIFHPFRKTYHREFYALKNLSFEVKKGETIGVIGENGAGKTTLLQILYNVLVPTKGTAEVNGKASALLELGMGFNPEFTGIENIYLYGSIMGFSKTDIDEKLNNVLSFAEIGEFVNQPMKIYSAGMYVRLAFAAATMIEPDVLIIDEALSVGDIFFQAKCIDRMKKMIDEKNVTLIYVSHDMLTVKSICNKAIILNKGVIKEYGKSSEVVEKYITSQLKEHHKKVISDLVDIEDNSKKLQRNIKDRKYKAFEDNSVFQKNAQYQRVQNGKAEIKNVQLLNEKEEPVYYIEYGTQAMLRVAIEIHQDIPKLDFGYQIRDKNGIEVIQADSVFENKRLHNLKKGDKYVVDWYFTVSLSHMGNTYTILTGLVNPINYDMQQFEICDRVPISVQFEVMIRKEFPLLGLVCWDNRVKVTKY
jgi:lipopolysaccharide transport system ATP-binding protein